MHTVPPFVPNSAKAPWRSRFISAAILVFELAMLSTPLFGQSLTARPVARLIGETAAPSRARRVGAAAVGTTAKPASPTLAEATPEERRAFEVTNRLREQNGVAPLAWDHELCRMARAHSEDMATHGFFSHESPSGLRARDRARAVGIPHFRVLGENIAYNLGYEDPGAFAVERWMVSPGHRANILSSEFEASAIGVFVATDGTVYLTQVFITR